MKPFSILAGLAAGIVGALLWGFITYKTSYQIGFLAWGVGALVGFVCVIAGGGGRATAFVAALIALASIFLGEMMGTRWHYHKDVEHYAKKEVLTKEHYDLFMVDVEKFKEVKDESEYPKYMMEQGYVEVSQPSEITPEDLAAFKESEAPYLRELGENPPTFEQWKEMELKYIDAAAQDVQKEITWGDVFEDVKSDFIPYGAVFMLLGVLSAWKIVDSADS